jgi:phosphoribosylanthranilate isomerase
MFTVKICGITCVEDALAVAEAGADAIGLNFYPPSLRHISTAMAREIIAALPPGIVKVGLFVNADAEAMCQAFDDLGLDLLQLHGDEPPSMLEKLGGRPLMKAFRVEPNELGPVVRYIEKCDQIGQRLRLVLLDAKVDLLYGGTGIAADWPTARQYARTVNYPPLVLAGGLTPQNVAGAIRATGASAVDTASGVESQPGHKDPRAVARFVQAAREAFALNSGQEPN